MLMGVNNVTTNTSWIIYKEINQYVQPVLQTVWHVIVMDVHNAKIDII
jgi:hypothetical protein